MKKGSRPSWDAEMWENWCVSRVMDKLTADLGCKDCEWGRLRDCGINHGIWKRCPDWELWWLDGGDWFERAQKEWAQGKWRRVGEGVDTDVEKVLDNPG
jgi:hypothetical protein